MGPLMMKYSGVLSTKSLDDLQARALFESYEDLRMDPLARVGSARRGIVDNSHLRSSDLSYLISLRSGFVSLRQKDRCIVQPYSPYRFSRQFRFVQNLPGKLKEKNQSASLQAMYMHWESCTRACTNVVITLPAKDEFKSNPVTRVYARWWSKVYYKNLGMASGTNSSHSSNDMSREGCHVVPMQAVALDCTSATPLQDRPVALAPQRPCLSPRHPDVSEEAGDEVDFYEDGFILQQCQQVDSDVNFRHKKKEVFRPPLLDDYVPLERDVGLLVLLIWQLQMFIPILRCYLRANYLQTGRSGIRLVQSLFQIRRTSQGPNLSGTEQVIHRISLSAAMDIKSHIEDRISKCPLEDLTLLNEDLSKLVSVIDNLNVDSSSLKIKIAELMAASTEYSSLRAISLEKLSPHVRAHQLATINSSLAQVQSSQQAPLGDYQVRLDTLARKREQLVIEASQLESVLVEQGTTLSQYQEEISRLEREKCMTMELPILSPTEAETLKTLESLLEDRLRNGVTILEESSIDRANLQAVFCHD
ncbi:unnamed protein product [Malus baccata var. baccata]